MQRKMKPEKHNDTLDSLVFNGRMPVSRMIDKSLSLSFRYWRLFLLPAFIYALFVTTFNYLTSSDTAEHLEVMKKLLTGAEDQASIKDTMISSYSGGLFSGLLSAFFIGLLAAYFAHVFKRIGTAGEAENRILSGFAKFDFKHLVSTVALLTVFFIMLAVIAVPLSLSPILLAWSFSMSPFFIIFLSFISISLGLGIFVVFFARLLLVPIVAADEEIYGHGAFLRSWRITATLPGQSFGERPINRLTVLLTVVMLLTAFLKSFGSAPTDIGYIGLLTQLSGNLSQGASVDIPSLMEQLVPPSETAVAASFVLQVLLETFSTAFLLLSLNLFYFDLKAGLLRRSEKVAETETALSGRLEI